MQNRYVGDVNDFFKYVVLRRLADLSGMRLGINWYWTDPEVVDIANPQNDGGHITYLTDENNWRQQFNEPLFRNLQALLVVNGVVDNELRTVANIEASGILPDNTLFHIAEVPEETNDRERWHNDAMGAMNDAELVFLDPDNSVCEIYQQEIHRRAKYATPEEVIDHLGGGRSLLYISHPPHLNRYEHHNAQTDLFVDLPPGYVFCSAYTGNCGFHLICPSEDNTPGILQALITEGHNLPEGTFRYFDTTGKEINSGAQPLDAPNGLQNDGADDVPPLDEVEDIQDDGADNQIEDWSYWPVVVNNHGNLWKIHNDWINPERCWDVRFLRLDEDRILPVRFEPFENPDHRNGLRPVDINQNMETWNQISHGASNANLLRYHALVREIPCD
jgi:hypothetical protein